MKSLKTLPITLWTKTLKVLIFILGLPILTLGGFFMFQVTEFAFELWGQMLFLKPIFYTLLVLTAVLFIIILLKVIQVITQFERHEIFSLRTQTLFTQASIYTFIVSAIYMLFLPIFYIAADLDDAPGFVLIGLFFVVLSFALALLFWVITNIIKQAQELAEESKWVV